MRVKYTLAALAVTALTTGAAAVGVAGTAAASPAPSLSTAAVNLAASSQSQPGSVRLALTPSSAQLAACMPRAKVTVNVALRTNQTGRDVFHIEGRQPAAQPGLHRVPAGAGRRAVRRGRVHR